MFRAGSLAGLALSMALAASLTIAASAVAQETGTMELELTPSRGSGVSGSATITEEGEGARVELSVEGLPKEGIEHINHFHAGGTCADDRAGDPAPATIPLETIVANADGTGSASTTLRDVTLSRLFDPEKRRYVALHAETEEGQGVPAVISCADVVEAAGAGAVSAELPESGGPHPMVLLSVVTCSVLSFAAGLILLRRLGA